MDGYTGGPRRPGSEAERFASPEIHAEIRMFLDRAQEHMIAGNRPSATAKVRVKQAA